MCSNVLICDEFLSANGHYMLYVHVDICVHNILT